ncbi:zinc finger family protein [Salvia divinorum]|uniref:Zinc finger family protein n=1 Tax=Salvia divinorum TaxID=28513 RepID=A0ABD1FYI6_SALDI
MANNSNDGSSSNPNRPSPGRGRRIPSPQRPTTELALFTPPRSAAPPPPQHWPPSGSRGPAFPGSHSASAVPVGEGGGSGIGGAVRVGGSPLGRKRAAADGGGEGDRMYNCSVCNKAFSSPRAVFGHMRKHPDRGWTGAHPPPAFRAEEEFADLPVGQAVDNAEAPAAAEEEEGNYRVPDLNNPPPPESN